MQSITLITLAFTLLLNPLSAYVLPPQNEVIHHYLKRQATGPVAQLTAILANPNACPASTGECVTPSDALNPILSGLAKYQINTAPEQAAVVSLMAFESVDFQYNHNVFPGRAGQGTRAMLEAPAIQNYVNSLPELAGQAKALTGTDDATLNARLKLVQDNAHSFAAASWYYTTCSADVKAQVKAGGRAGWVAYLGCVGVTADASREAYWLRACKELSAPTA